MTGHAEAAETAYDALLSGMAPECQARTCPHTASHALVFRSGCPCAHGNIYSWMLCIGHVERGLRELRERYEWRCSVCEHVGFYCHPERLEKL
jgi:hypothetical protein